MGNTHSMNNLSLLEQKRYQTEFLRYSQIPYESQYRPQNPNLNVNHHQYNKFKEPHQMPNPVKVLPNLTSEPKLRTTNNGAILQSGGTISGRKESECGLHRSKSISETQNTYLSNDPNGMTSVTQQQQQQQQHHQPQFKMQRASTQLSISLNQQQLMRGNLNKNFGSSHDLKLPEVKTSKNAEKNKEVKKTRAPPPPTAAVNQKSNLNRTKMSASTTSLLQSSDQAFSKTKGKTPMVMSQRLFGDTLIKNSTPNRTSAQQQFTPTHPIKSKESVSAKSAVSKIVPPPAVTTVVSNNLNATKPSRINPISYFRRERTFDMSLTQTQNAEKFKPKFSPQFQRKTTAPPMMTNLPRMEVIHTAQKTSEIRQMTTQERYRANLSNRTSAVQAELSGANKHRVISAVKSNNDDKMQTIDKKPTNNVEKTAVAAKKSSDNSAISNPTMSTSSSFKYTKAKQEAAPFENGVTAKENHHHLEANFVTSREPIIKEQQILPINNSSNNFYYGMQEASVDTDDNDDEEIVEGTNQAQMDAINKFAEDIFKMSSSGSKNQAYSESVISDSADADSDNPDITINLRPTLPRRMLQIPRFSPLAAWKSLAVDVNSSDSKNSGGRMLSASMMQLHNEEIKHETKIERIYREPSFNLQQMDNKSGDSGISADKEVGNSPDSAQMPQAYLVSSWTPQQDLEEDEESVEEKESYHQPNEADKSQSFATASNGHMFSLSLPRDNHSTSDKMPQNNFYSLQKFRKSIVDVFNPNGNEPNNKIQVQNYGVDSNWLLGSQPNSIDELAMRKEIERNQVMISQMTSGKHIMYLPTNMEYIEEKPGKYETTVCINSNNYENERDEMLHEPKLSPSKNHRFKFQSTIRKIERKKMAEKLSKEAEEQEVLRLTELEAMQRVEEEFQKKRAREKNRIRHQLRIASLEAENVSQFNIGLERPNSNRNHTDYYYNNDNDEDEIDTRTPYISRIIEAKSPRIVGSQYKS